MCVIEDGRTIAAFGVHDCWPESEIEVTFALDWKLKVIRLFAGIFSVVFFLFGVCLQCVMSPKHGVVYFFF
jgi:hypothetical protein